MVGNLLEITTKQLLAKFGQGSHKPGSGSAAALNALLCAELLKTVIGLSTNPKRRKNYHQAQNQLLEIRKQIDLKIYPELEHLFQLDSIEFDSVIQLREKRDKTDDPLEKAELSLIAREALKPAIEVPLKISALAIELAGFAMFVFDHGFKAARGDSSVALNNAVAALGDCLAIIELNLKSCDFTSWTEDIREKKMELKKMFTYFNSAGLQRIEVLAKESDDSYQFQKNLAEFRNGNLGDTINGDKDLETLVKRFQNTIWLNRKHIWKTNDIDALGVLKPAIIIEKALNYVYKTSENLGMFEIDGDLFEVAGLIDKQRKLVQTKRDLDKRVLNFTLAHELGHALLHNQKIMHRDRPLDGSLNIPRTKEEAQADKFAAYFLMPSNIVREVFEGLFHTSLFTINGDTALGLSVPVYELVNYCKNLRDLSRLISRTKYYKGQKFKSLAEIFCVSDEAMAIRLEELNLISLDGRDE